MSSFIAANSLYNICTENEISAILSHFSSDFIFGVIEDNINNRFNFYQLDRPNIVNSFETYFKQLQTIYTSDLDLQNIINTREQTYIEIINILCNKFQLQFNIQNSDNRDLYSIAYYLYSFLVSDFTRNVIMFYSNYIIKERNYIYSALNLNEMKRNKDTTTLYNKRTYKNSKIAIISANLDIVIDNVSIFDIPFELLLNTVYEDKNIVSLVYSTIVPYYDFFKSIYVPLIKGQLRPIILTEIRLEIQRQSISEDINIDNINK